MRPILIVMVLATTVAAAPSAPGLTAVARVEAQHGRCVVVADLAAQVDRIDHAYFANVFAADPNIVACNVAAVAAVAPVVATPPAPIAAIASTTELGWYATVMALVNTSDVGERPGTIVGARAGLGATVAEAKRWRLGLGLVVDGHTVSTGRSEGAAFGAEAIYEVTRDGDLWFGPRLSLSRASPGAFGEGVLLCAGGRVRYGDVFASVDYTKSTAGHGVSLGLGIDGRPGKYTYGVGAVSLAIGTVIALSLIASAGTH